MKNRLLGIALSAALGAGCALAQAPAHGNSPTEKPRGSITAIPWLQPPPEFKEMQREGFHAGVKAAMKDFDHHKDPDLERHKDYVHPKVGRSYLPDWRQGYKRGYNDAYKHLVKTHGQAS